VKTMIVYSSKTGNTKKVAEAIYNVMPETADIFSVDENPDYSQYDVIFLGGWVDKGLIDKKAMAYLENIKNKKIAYFITIGAYPDSNHAKDVLKRTTEMVSKENEFLGNFICHGKIDPNLRKMFESFPPDHPHAMNEERKKRHEIASKHPDEQDLLNAQKTFLEILENIKS